MLRIALLFCAFTGVLNAQRLALSGVGTPIPGTAYSFVLGGPNLAGASYFTGLSQSAAPGIEISTGTLSLTPDALMSLGIAEANGPRFPAFFGTLNGQGQAAPVIVVPNEPALAGFTWFTAGVALSGGELHASNTLRRTVRSAAPAYDWSAVDQALAAALAAQGPFGTQGLAFVLVKDGEIKIQRGLGGFTPTTRVRLASATKWASAFALLTLLSDGLVGLDDPVSMWLPNFTGDKAGITLRQCFSHTSGLPEQASCLGNTTITLEACVNQIAAGPLPNPPGTAFAYGGTSMQVAGRVVEVVSGMPYGTFFQQRVSGPLGMTTFDYDGFGATLNPRLGGGGKCSVLDYAQLLLATLDGGAAAGLPLLPTDLIRTMAEDQTAGTIIVSSPHPSNQGYGLGLWRDEKAPSGEATWVSSPGAFGAFPWVDLERGYGALLLIDRVPSEGQAAVATLRPLIEAQIPKDVTL